MTMIADVFYPNVTQNSTADADIFKATDSLTNVSQQTLVSSMDEIARMLNLVIRPVLIAAGTIGDGLSFYIMRRGSLKTPRSSCVNIKSCIPPAV